MSYIPDCRTDENYNEKYLNEKSKVYIAGFDCAIETIVCMIEGNLDTFPELESAMSEDTQNDLAEAVKIWAESTRNELITSMIDTMSDEEYDSIKEQTHGRESNAEVDRQRAGGDGEEADQHL